MADSQGCKIQIRRKGRKKKKTKEVRFRLGEENEGKREEIQKKGNSD